MIDTILLVEAIGIRGRVGWYALVSRLGHVIL